MRLLTYKKGTEDRVGALIDERVVDLNLAYARYLQERGEEDASKLADEALPPHMISFLELGQKSMRAAANTISYMNGLMKKGEASDLTKTGIVSRLKGLRIKAPIPRPRKNIFCLGLNYAEHVAEGARARGEPPPNLPTDPIFFTKPPTAANGPYDPIVYPKATTMLDYEVELAFVIGRKGKYIAEEKAYDHIAGYMVFNDVTARDLQRKHGQWFKGKGLDGFAPMGPYLVTKDEVPDPQNLNLTLWVSGKERQKSNTKYMIFNIPTIVEALSAGLTLEPGDIVATGTPSGVGASMTPQGLLNVGDIVEVEVEGLGRLRNRVVAEPK